MRPCPSHRASSRSPGGRDRRLGRGRSRSGIRDISRELPPIVAVAKVRARHAAGLSRAARDLPPRSRRESSKAKDARHFFETHFRPVRISRWARPHGFLTGYYEPIVEGARCPTDDLHDAALPHAARLSVRRKRRERSPAKGRVGAQTSRASTCPTTTAPQIEDGALAGRDLEIAYLQGPERRLLHPDPGVGARAPRRRQGAAGELRRAQRPPLHAGRPHPDRARHRHARGHVDGRHPQVDGGKSRRRAKSCGGRTSPMCSSARPTSPKTRRRVGAQGIPLTADRSIAVDRNLHVYGTPFFIDGELPIASETSRHQVPPPDDRAGHRLARLSGRPAPTSISAPATSRKRRRPPEAFRPLRDADPERARSGCGDRQDAAAASAPARAAHCEDRSGQARDRQDRAERPTERPPRQTGSAQTGSPQNRRPKAETPKAAPKPQPANLSPPPAPKAKPVAKPKPAPRHTQTKTVPEQTPTLGERLKRLLTPTPPAKTPKQ